MKDIKGVVFDIGGIFVKDPWEWMLYMAPNSIANELGLDKVSMETAGSLAWKSCDRKNHPGTLTEQERAYWKIFLSELDSIPEIFTPEYLMERSPSYIQTLNISKYRELLTKLSENNLSLSICSNNTEFWFAHEWQAIKLQEFFREEDIILSNKIGATKSSDNGEMFYAVKDSLGIPFEQLIFFDDRIHNIEKSKQLGMKAVHVKGQSENTFYHIEKELEHILVYS